MLSLATSRSKKPSAQPPNPNVRLGFRRDRRKQGGLSVCSPVAVHESAIGPSRHFGKMWNLVAIGRIVDMARLAAGSTRSRMTQLGDSPVSI